MNSSRNFAREFFCVKLARGKICATFFCMTTLLLATRNAHKVSEIHALLGAQFHILTLKDFPAAPPVVEDQATFVGNALKKADTLANWLAAGNLKSEIRNVKFDFVLADDSGLEVDALHGDPGVHSARFAALEKTENSPDADNNAKLLRLLQNVAPKNRTARFRCVIALVPVPAKKVEVTASVGLADEFPAQIFDGACEGMIRLAPNGSNGFGYDPLFVPNGFEKSFGELGEDVKNKISHRAKALAKLKEFFNHQATQA